MRDLKKYHELPYNPKLKERACGMRKAGNLAEVILWRELRSGKLNGLDFDRQKIVGHFITDFHCAEKKVIIEIDGSSHDGKAEYDAERNSVLEGLGLTVIHILDTDVKENIQGVMLMLKTHPALVM